MLLAVADEAGLPALRATALDWMVHNYAAVAGTAAYRALTKEQSDLVAAAACALFQRCQTLLQVNPRFWCFSSRWAHELSTRYLRLYLYMGLFKCSMWTCRLAPSLMPLDSAASENHSSGLECHFRL